MLCSYFLLRSEIKKTKHEPNRVHKRGENLMSVPIEIPMELLTFNMYNIGH